MVKFNRMLAAAALLAGAIACSDAPLEVDNDNNPDTDRVLRTPADVEKLIKDSYNAYFVGTHGDADPGIYAQMSAMAFEHSAMAANFGMVERSALPRQPINNAVSDQFHPQYIELWRLNYSAIKSAGDGLRKFADPTFTMGTPERDARAKAFAKFVQGLGHGTLALTYDQASVLDERMPLANPDGSPFVPELSPYPVVMDSALAYLDEAIAIASATTFTLEANWINGNPLTSAQFIRLARTYKAKFRAQVARTPAERAAVDWTAVVDDATNGIEADFTVALDNNVWFLGMPVYHSFYGAWNQAPYFIHGMADNSGAYQAWMVSEPVMARQAFVITTTDKRFPQGATAAAQEASPGLYLKFKGNGGGWVRAERGQFRWSNYADTRFADFYDPKKLNFIGKYPIVKKAEVDLLAAEGMLQTDPTGAAALINKTRVAIGGLPSVDAAGVPSAPDCVPKLPNGSCGSLLEALKWEKRLETWGTDLGAWYFDSRGWGDLAQGTPLHWPVPAREMEVRRLPTYTFGGSGEGSAAVGTYGY